MLAVVVALSGSLWLSALNVVYRDVRFIVPFLIQIWLFLTPVIYPASVVVPRLEELGFPEWAVALNPMVGAIEGFRSAILGGAVFGDHCSPISDTTILSSMASSCDHVDHVRTQLPYALLGAGLAVFVGYLPEAFVGISPWLLLVVGFVVIGLWIKLVAQPVE